MAVELRTSCYAGFKTVMGVAVATSIGQPKWPLPYALEAEVRDLMPFGLFGRDLPWPEFAAGYRERLDRIGTDRLRRQFEQIAAEHPGRPLVLLCWEKPGEPCHRRVFASWWREATGEDVPEQPAQTEKHAQFENTTSGQVRGQSQIEMEMTEMTDPGTKPAAVSFAAKSTADKHGSIGTQLEDAWGSPDAMASGSSPRSILQVPSRPVQ